MKADMCFSEIPDAQFKSAEFNDMVTISNNFIAFWYRKITFCTW